MEKIFRLFLLSLILSVFSFVGYSQEKQDSTYKYEALDNKLDEYFDAIKEQSIKVKNEECDFLISSCKDSLIRQHVALYCYAHYIDSRIMGDEAVSIHLTDTWFAPGKIKMLEDFDFLNAMVFAEFNRQSLIGEKAPELKLETFQGDSLSLLSSGQKRLRVLYFYDTTCSRCKLETPLLCRALDNVAFPVDVYAVYVGASKESWASYIEKFSTTSTAAKIYHLWDTSRSSDFERKYGVLQTPRMYLIDRSGTIIGRGLNTEALIELLNQEYPSRTYEYGSDQSSAMYDEIFSSEDGSTLMNVADHIAESTLAQGDTLTFKKMSGDLLYWLSSQREESFRTASKSFLEKYILGDNNIWLDQWDSLKVVGLGEMMDGLLSKTPIGEKVPSYKLKGLLITSKGEASKSLNLRKIKGTTNYIIFHTTGCSVCENELAAARQKVKKDKGMEVFAVNVDQIVEQDESLSVKLFDSFDLSALPFMLQTAKDGTILRKYVSLTTE